MASIYMRFWSKVSIGNGCWEWNAGIDKYGYGQFVFEGKLVKAHRMAFFLANGKWPEPSGLHTCDNSKCVRPDHVEEGTQLKNIRDCVIRQRHWHTVKTHCSKGHEFSPENTCVRGSHRTCRTCKRERAVKYTRLRSIKRREKRQREVC